MTFYTFIAATILASPAVKPVVVLRWLPNGVADPAVAQHYAFVRAVLYDDASMLIDRSRAADESEFYRVRVNRSALTSTVSFALRLAQTPRQGGSDYLPSYVVTVSPPGRRPASAMATGWFELSSNPLGGSDGELGEWRAFVQGVLTARGTGVERRVTPDEFDVAFNRDAMATHACPWPKSWQWPREDARRTPGPLKMQAGPNGGTSVQVEYGKSVRFSGREWGVFQGLRSQCGGRFEHGGEVFTALAFPVLPANDLVRAEIALGRGAAGK